MGRPARIDSSNDQHKLHFIVEWAERRGLSQADISRRLEVDKSTVFRWFQGHLPAERHLIGLAEYFSIEVTDLFRDPEDSWLTRLLRDKPASERHRIEQAIKLLIAP